MFHREFLWPTSAKWVQTLIFCIIVIRNGLNDKRSLYSSVNFTFLSNLVNSLLTGNDLCHSQPKPQHFIIINASHSMHCSSVEAYLPWKCCYFNVDTYSHKPWIAWDILLVILSVTGNLCNKCPKRLVEQNSSYSDYFNVISGLYRTADPQEALWHIPIYLQIPSLFASHNVSSCDLNISRYKMSISQCCRFHWSSSFIMTQLKRTCQYWRSCIAESLWKTGLKELPSPMNRDQATSNVPTQLFSPFETNRPTI